MEGGKRVADYVEGEGGGGGGGGWVGGGRGGGGGVGGFFFQAEDGIRDRLVTGVQTCALPIFLFICYIITVKPYFIVYSLFLFLILILFYKTIKLIKIFLLSRTTAIASLTIILFSLVDRKSVV